jgi:integrase
VWASLSAAADFHTVGAIVDAYLGPKDRPDPVPDAKRKREAWAAAMPYWAALRPAAVDECVSLAYPAWRKRSANTVRQELSLIRTALNWAVASKHLDAAPKVTLPAMPETSVGHLTKQQFRTFLGGCAAPHVRLFAMLGVTTGGRKSALLQALWTQVDFARALLQLNPEGRTQNSKYRATVPLNDMILPALREAKAAAVTGYIIEHRGKPLLDIKKGFAAASHRSGVHCHPHMLRHSAAVWMAEDRVPMAEIASYLGHRDLNVTVRIYARFHPEYLRDAASSLRW